MTTPPPRHTKLSERYIVNVTLDRNKSLTNPKPYQTLDAGTFQTSDISDEALESLAHLAKMGCVFEWLCPPEHGGAETATVRTVDTQNKMRANVKTIIFGEAAND